jgi:thioredoxin-like negative regulator of GroEL
MIPLQKHEQFEELYTSTKEPILVYFTADWCGACKHIDWEFILSEFPDLPVYKCNIDENKYTPGFCQVRSIPSFMIVHPGKRVTGPFQTSATAKAASWIYSNLK